MKKDEIKRAAEARQLRAHATRFQTRQDEGTEDIYIEGHFAVFDSIYELWPGASESIAPGAFKNTLNRDIKALTNHDSTLVLGRTTATTLALEEKNTGLWGSIKINRADSDAMNLYSRVQRGDVDQCSFGFDIVSEETDYRADGTIHWTITEVVLYEVSVVTFPAYEDTSVDVRQRQKQYEEIKKRSMDAWRQTMRNKIKEG